MKNQTKKGTMLLTIVTAITMLFSACCKDADKNDLVKKELEITREIKGIIIEGPWEVVVAQNNENNSAVIEYNIPAKKVSTTLHPNGYLHIKVSNLTNYCNLRLKATICAAALETIEGSGATVIYPYGQYKTPANISLSGASRIDGFFCEGDYIELTLSGASKLNNCSFQGKYVDANLSGASNATFRSMETNRCKVNASGASRFYANGFAAETTFTGSGSSSFDTFDLESENLDIDLSGASSAEVTVNHTIKGSLTGASTLKYRKAEDVSGISTSGGSKIIKVN